MHLPSPTSAVIPHTFFLLFPHSTSSQYLSAALHPSREEYLRMSANYDSRESTSHAEKSTLPTSRKDTSMDSGRYSYRQQLKEPTTESSSMSTLTLRAGPSVPPSSSLSWHQAGPSSMSPRNRSPSHSALLPGIQSVRSHS
jgi:hypothetical protein